MDELKLLIAEDEPVARQAMARLFDLETDIKVVGEAENGEVAVDLACRAMPDVVLMDIRMPKLDGIRATHIIKQEMPSVAIVILTIYDDDQNVFQAIKAGAIGYILKDCGKEQLLNAIFSAAQGVPLVASTITQKLVSILQQQGDSPQPEGGLKGVYETLTERETDILRLVAKGYSNKSIARELGITISTVKTHLRNIFRKLDVEDRAQVIIKAIKDGVI